MASEVLVAVVMVGGGLVLSNMTFDAVSKFAGGYSSRRRLKARLDLVNVSPNTPSLYPVFELPCKEAKTKIHLIFL